MSSKGFYRAFEERYRGSRELIKKRLEIYLPFIAPLLKLHEPAAALDLGCGRGEWLELLQEHAFLPQGVDRNAEMLEACRERGLRAVNGDALAHLQSLPGESQCIVSAFHFAEHISFDDLETLVAQAKRVLKPGGLLILETPNPENILVGASNFYLDPTHVRPLPPSLLAFLPEWHGYARFKIVRLQESIELKGRPDPGLLDVLGGASPDYALVAQKGADSAVLDLFGAAFDTRYGLELEELTHRYDRRAETCTAGVLEVLSRFEQLHKELDARMEARAAEIKETLSRFEQSHCRIEARAVHAEVLAKALDQQIRALRNSASWRITAPLRRIGAMVLKVPMARASHVVAKDPVGHAIRFVLQRPLLKRVGNLLLKPFPRVEAYLAAKHIAQSRSRYLSDPVRNAKGASGYLALHQERPNDGPVTVAANGTPLRAEEILLRIRKELADASKTSVDDVK